MADTPQPLAAGDPEPTREDTLQDAASAFKVALGQEEAPEQPERLRAPNGQFVSPNAEEETEEIEAADEGEPEAVAENDEGDEAAEEAQSTAPASWSKEEAELWESLPPEAQAVISKREGERDRAVNQKFQEAAQVRAQNEHIINEANINRQRFAQAADWALSLSVPPPPPITMLDINSGDYDPDQYHYQKHIHEQTVAQMQGLQAQRQQMAAQEQMQNFHAINNATRDAFIQDVPDAADQAKAPAVFQGLMEYAVELGAPLDIFQTPTTALEWRVLWKAREYDRLQKAKARVGEQPAPPPRKASPAVRPGVTTPRSAIEKANRGRALDRLKKEGSVEAGAAVWKNLMKG